MAPSLTITITLTLALTITTTSIIITNTTVIHICIPIHYMASTQGALLGEGVQDGHLAPIGVSY